MQTGAGCYRLEDNAAVARDTFRLSTYIQAVAASSKPRPHIGQHQPGGGCGCVSSLRSDVRGLRDLGKREGTGSEGVYVGGSWGQVHAEDRGGSVGEELRNSPTGPSVPFFKVPTPT